jgi:predicted flap endonuclease-1-like 5' DNA nuclease
MPYTLMKGLAWVLVAVVLGIVIGWLLRSVTAKRQVERARAANAGASHESELNRLRSRVANLEPVVNERDRLKSELDAERRQRAAAGSDAAPDLIGESEAHEFTGGAPTTPTTSTAPTVPVVDRFDLDEASAVLGRKVELNDLTVVEGIGPKIADLCQGIGITTWAELSLTEVSLLRTMLTDAGQRFKAHDPTTWPRQAALLAVGAWTDFKALTDSLDGGRPVG